MTALDPGHHRRTTNLLAGTGPWTRWHHPTYIPLLAPHGQARPPISTMLLHEAHPFGRRGAPLASRPSRTGLASPAGTRPAYESARTGSLAAGRPSHVVAYFSTRPMARSHLWACGASARHRMCVSVAGPAHREIAALGKRDRIDCDCDFAYRFDGPTGDSGTAQCHGTEPRSSSATAACRVTAIGGKCYLVGPVWRPQSAP